MQALLFVRDNKPFGGDAYFNSSLLQYHKSQPGSDRNLPANDHPYALKGWWLSSRVA